MTLTESLSTGKKLKRRLEDLERRAGSSDEAETEKPATTTPKSTKRQSASKSPSKAATTQAKAIPRNQFTPPMEASDDLVFGAPSFDERERNASPPMFNSYTTYPAPDDMLLQPYGATQPYPAITTTEQYANYLTATTMPSSLPSLTHFSDNLKRESFSSAEDSMGSYMSYNFVPGLDMSYDPNSNPHVSTTRFTAQA